MIEDEYRMKNDKYLKIRYISHVEILCQILKYPEVITDLVLVSISTMPIEYRSGI